ncbi:163_t:CDS:2, partial [Acaulospora colombiana]
NSREIMSSGILTTPVVDHFINLAHTIGTLADPFVSPMENVVKFTLNSTFPGTYQYFVEILEGYKSPFADRLPLMDPFHGLSAFHNFLMVSLSGYMCATIWMEARKNGYTLFANPEDRTEKGFQMAKYTWLFYFSKIFEFMDTFIMVLKKNNHQVSFLHVYHHSTIFVIWWWVIYVAPTGETYFSASLNA